MYFVNLLAIIYHYYSYYNNNCYYYYYYYYYCYYYYPNAKFNHIQEKKSAILSNHKLPFSSAWRNFSTNQNSKHYRLSTGEQHNKLSNYFLDNTGKTKRKIFTLPFLKISVHTLLPQPLDTSFLPASQQEINIIIITSPTKSCA